MNDVLLGSDESDVLSSDDESRSMLDIPDNLNYRWPRNIVEIGEIITVKAPNQTSQLQLKLYRAVDKICAFGSIGNTRICCVVLTPVNESDQEDFEAGVSVKMRGADYVDDICLRECITNMIPSNRLKRIFIDITFHVYSDDGCVVPASLMTAMLALSASRIDVKGIVTAVSVLITPSNEMIVNPSQGEEQKAREKIPGYAYVTAVKFMKDDHLRWWDVEGLPKESQVSLAVKRAAREATELYPHVSLIVQKLMENSGPSGLSI